MKQRSICPEPPRHRLAVVIWMGIYPTTTCALFAIDPFLSSLPLPLRTLAQTAIVVPTMVYVVLPVLQRLFARWLASGDRDDESPSVVQRMRSAPSHR